MLNFLFNVLAFLLLATVAVHSVVLHLRLRRLRGALADAGRVLPSLDASVDRMSEIVSGFAQKLQADLTDVETRLTTSRRIAAELAAANRTAEDVATQLDRLLRQHRRLDSVRPAPIPRELVEPKGLLVRTPEPARAG